MEENKIFHVEIDSPVWNQIWTSLGNHPINIGIKDPFTAEYNGNTWQYLSSKIREGTAYHQFRHRLHPGTQRKEVIDIAIPLDGDEKTDIQTS